MIPVDFGQSVLLDGVEVAGITIAGSTIRRGSGNLDDGAPPPSTCYLELIAYDAAGDLTLDFPGIGWRGGIRSGFVTEYADEYEGVLSSLELGKAIEVRTTSPSGFVTEYVDDYLAGFESTRFVGTIAAIDYTPALIAVTAIDDVEKMTRVDVDTSTFPAETELERVARIAQLADVTITIEGTSSITVVKGPDAATWANAYTVLEKLATDCDSVFYSRRNGELVYRTHDAPTVPGTTRRNLVKNPTLDADTMTWIPSTTNYLLTWDPDTYVGRGCALVESLITTGQFGMNTDRDADGRTAVVEGRTYTLSAWAKRAVGSRQARVQVNYYESATSSASLGVDAGTYATLSPDAWTRLTLTFTVPTGQGIGYAQVRAVISTGAIPASVKFDGFLLEEGPDVLPYFDGGYTDPGNFGATVAWDGTPNASESILTAPLAVNPGATLIDSLKMTQELGMIVNRIVVGYGQNAEVTLEDAESIAAYGLRDVKISTELSSSSEATAHGQRLLDHYATPSWHMPTVDVSLSLARSAGDSYPDNLAQLLDLDLDDQIGIGPLLDGSPLEAYTSRVLGYTETLDPYEWQLRYDLNPAGWTRKEPNP